MGPDGALEIDHCDDHLPQILGTVLDAYLAAPVGVELRAALDAVMARVHAEAAEVELTFSILHPSSAEHALLATVCGLRVGDRGGATLTLRQLDPRADAEPLQESGPAGPRPALMMVAPAADGRLGFTFVEEDVGRLVGLTREQLAGSPAAAVIMARAAAILAAEDFSAELALSRLMIADTGWGGRMLVCRLLRGIAASGAAVGLWIGEAAVVDAPPSPHARHIDGLLRLLRLSGILLERVPPKEGLKRLACEIAGAPGTRHVVIARYRRRKDGLAVLARGRQPGRTGTPDLVLSIHEGACATAMAERRLVADWPRGENVLHVYAPIEAGEEVLGVLAISADPDIGMDGWQEEIIGSCADYVAAFMAGVPARPRALRGATRSRRDDVDIAALLTARQQDVLFALVETGGSNREIARSHATTEATVKVHMRAILSALKVANRAEAIQLVYRRAAGWLARMRRRQANPAP